MEECIICFYEKPLEDYVCFSCGHRVCYECYPKLNNICPVCCFNESVQNETIQLEIVTPQHGQEVNPVDRSKIIIVTFALILSLYISIYLLFILDLH
jgi:hypothetical protein